MNYKIIVSFVAVLCVQGAVGDMMLSNLFHMPNMPHMPNLMDWLMPPKPTPAPARPSATPQSPALPAATSQAPARPSATSQVPVSGGTTAKPLTGDTESSFRVVDQLCSLPDSTIGPIAHDFGAGCYEQDGIPKEHFAACQNQIFGCTWDTLSCIRTNCPRFHDVYPSYVNCIVGRFNASGLTIAKLFECGTKVNVCQGALAGLITSSTGSPAPAATSQAPVSTTPKPLTGDTESSFRVVDQLCSLPDSTIGQIAHDFGAGCYEQDGIPKEHFAACQNQIFGCTWDTLSCIRTNCPRFHDVYPSYVNCIVGRFNASGLTIAKLFECGTKVNVCQGALAGLPTSSSGSPAPAATSQAPVSAGTTAKTLTGDTESSFRVVDKLCSLPDSTIGPIAHDFGAGCYEQDGIPKEHFAACQNQIFGCTWDTLPCIRTNCPRFHDVYPSYVNCIVGRFNASGLPISQLFECGTKVNVCQGALAGL